MSIFLTRHGKYERQWGEERVLEKEAQRVGLAVRELAASKRINLKIARVVTSEKLRTQDTARGIAEINGITIPPQGFLADPRIFDGYPDYGNWKVSKEIRWAMILVREQIAQIWEDVPLIIVGHLPSVWWIWSELEPESFPEYCTENDGDIGDLIGYGSTVIVPRPKT